MLTGARQSRATLEEPCPAADERYHGVTSGQAHMQPRPRYHAVMPRLGHWKRSACGSVARSIACGWHQVIAGEGRGTGTGLGS